MHEEFPDEAAFDVTTVGGGPNGLIAGARLARAGLSVVICERRFGARSRKGTRFQLVAADAGSGGGRVPPAGAVSGFLESPDLSWAHLLHLTPQEIHRRHSREKEESE
jgi:choline dehydrogenase-like flavoprotein